MIEETKRIEEIEQEAKAAELSELDLDQVAGGGANGKKGYISGGHGNAETFGKTGVPAPTPISPSLPPK